MALGRREVHSTVVHWMKAKRKKEKEEENPENLSKE